MQTNNNAISRRRFLAVSGALAGTTIINPKSQIYANTPAALNTNQVKQKIALVGTGIRGVKAWGRDVIEGYSDYVDYVGLCDNNIGRLEVGKKLIGTSCPTYTDFDKMMKETKPDSLIVTTVDDTHDYSIPRAMK